MCKTHIYCGDNLFRKIPEFSDNILFFPKMLSKLVYAGENSCNLSVDEIILGWSFNIYRCGYKYIHVGFPNLKGERTEVFKSDHNDSFLVTCKEAKVIAATRNGKFFIYSTRNMMHNVYDFSSEKLDIKNLLTGDIYTVVLNKDGTIFLFFEEQKRLKKLDLSCKITQVACGKEHILLLSDTGQVYSFGNGSRGQLGHGNIFNNDSPELIEALDGINIKSVACGGWHSAAISNSGDLYMWGWNESGQLGFSSTEESSNTVSSKIIDVICCTPKVVDIEEEKLIRSVSCGSRHSAVFTEDKEIWTWGWNEYGQLCCDEFSFSCKPHRVSLPDGFVPEQVTCAFWSTLIAGTMSV